MCDWLWQVVHLASEVFHYHANDRMKIRMRRFATEQWPTTIGKRVSQDLPLKVVTLLLLPASSLPDCSVHLYLYTQVGSFQVFVKGYKDAEVQLEEFKSDVLPPHLERALQLEFERLVVLDYIIRNTDRGNDNWLLRYEEPTIHGELNDVDISLDTSRSVCQLPLFCGTRELGATAHSWEISFYVSL